MATSLFPPGAPDVLYLVDFSNYVLRAYHAIAPLQSPTGEPTQAVLGTVTMLDRLVRQCRPVYLAIAMDSGRATFRSEIYHGYKANRPPAPDDLKQQMTRCEQIVRAYNVPVFKTDGLEADDLIASAVRLARQQQLKTVILAADKDLMQLVGPDVMLWDTLRDRVFGPPEVEERFGIRVSQLRDYLALTGDSSDNIPGVPSVGPKTAQELLSQLGSLENLYAHLDQVPKKAVRERLTEHRDAAFLSQRLVTLKEDCAIPFDLAALRYGGRNLDALRLIYAELGFQRQLQQLETAPQAQLRLSIDGNQTVPEVSQTPEEPAALPSLPVAPEYRAVLSMDDLQALIQQAMDRKVIAFELGLSAPRPMRGAWVGISLCVEPGTAAYVPFGHLDLSAPPQLARARVLEALAPLLRDPKVRKVAHDLKRSAVVLGRHQLPLKGLGFDAMIASYLLDPEARHDREALIQRELGIVPPSYDTVTHKMRGSQLSFDAVPVAEATPYLAAQADYALRLSERLIPRIAEAGLEQLFRDLELPLTSVLADLEQRGVLVDTSRLQSLSRLCEQEILRLEQEAHKIAGRPFNVNSPRQLETLLFDEFGLKPLKRTKTARSTDADTLEALAEQHPLPKVILEIRQVAKLKGTYIDALPELVHPETGRIHTSWEQAVAATGRLSSTDPNLQNIPIRTELGRAIRQSFIAPPGHLLISADYSQIELRVLAHLSEDPVLLEAFRTGQDIHTRTAMEIFEVPEKEVTRELRTRAKAVNFGVIYGQGDTGLSKSLGIPRAEASNFIAAYFRRYQGVRRFMQETLEHARAGETAQSALGRRRLVPTIRSANRAERLAAERIAMNMPIQSTAADILKLAMLALAEPPTRSTRMILTVHDELVFEVSEDEVEEAMVKIKNAMEQVFPLAVPLVVDLGKGTNWHQAH